MATRALLQLEHPYPAELWRCMAARMSHACNDLNLESEVVICNFQFRRPLVQGFPLLPSQESL